MAYISMREIILKFNNKDYLDFQKVSNESGLTPDEKLKEIVEYYLTISLSYFAER
jgi:hypothetical protein